MQKLVSPAEQIKNLSSFFLKKKKKRKSESLKTFCELNLFANWRIKKVHNQNSLPPWTDLHRFSSQAADFLISVKKATKYFSTFVPCRMLNGSSTGLKCEQIQHNVLHKGLLRGSPGKPHRTLLIFFPLRWPAHSTRLLWWGYSPGTPPPPTTTTTANLLPSYIHTHTQLACLDTLIMLPAAAF